MLVNYRNIFVALAGLALAGAQQPSEQRHTIQRGQQTQATPARSATPNRTAEQPYRPYPNYQPDPCYNSSSHDAADLCAQWRAAIAAEKATHEARRATTWAIVVAFLSLATVIGLIITIMQTQGALGEARRGNLIAAKGAARATRRAISSAAETEAALDIARQNAKAAELNADATERAIAEQSRIGEAQVRCYLSAFDCVLHYKGDHWHVGCKVKNSGASPARFVTWAPTIAIIIQGTEHFRKIEVVQERRVIHIDVTMQDEKDLPIATFLVALDEAEKDALNRGMEVTFSLKANIRAIDVFEKEVRCDASFIGFLATRPALASIIRMMPAVKVDIRPDEGE